MTVLIYADEGVNAATLQEVLITMKQHFAHVEMVDHHYLCEEEWEKRATLLVIPGGQDIPYDRKLRGKGTAKIRKFVEEGGSFLGICAGAYFGAAEVIFEKGTPLEVHEKRDLSFFPGAAFGALYPDTPFTYESEKGSVPSHISAHGEEMHLFYKGGCSFKDPENFPGISVIARYKDVNDQAAIVHCQVGKGNVILSGVHFEVSPLRLSEKESDPKLISLLKESDEKREKLITLLFKKLNF
ncbi:MAG: hypothetical protein KDK76_04930 [Chlamydiia bacterium]|nr:hypothetical protein [Chlamydiia bacterium]